MGTNTSGETWVGIELDKRAEATAYLAPPWRKWDMSTRRAKCALVVVNVQNDLIDGTLALRYCPAGQEGYEVVVLDSLYNATREALNRVEALTGKTVTFVQLDIMDAEGLEKLFTETKFDAVIHFAGLKAVGESVAKPLFYYENNIGGTVNLLKAMAKGNCKNIVFSSSATVYGDPASVPVQEDFPISATNP